MVKKTGEALLRAFRAGELDLETTLRRLQGVGIAETACAKLDVVRRERTGVPEVVFCEGKTPGQVAEIMYRLASEQGSALGTRATAEHAAAVRRLKDCSYDPVSKLLRAGRVSGPFGKVVVVSAGTSDLPVAEEAAGTLEYLGSHVVRAYDCGVAGIHRVAKCAEEFVDAAAVIAVAGMEGALASVVAGVSPAPVVAVPTSVGYGAGFGGLAALLSMLNTCAPGVSVVNIDNGFGAACMAHKINLRSRTGKDRNFTKNVAE